MTIRITCINKDNGHHDDPHEAITELGWEEVGNTSNHKVSSRAAIVKFLEDGNRAYVKDRYGDTADLMVFTKNGIKYVKTRPDQTIADNLLELDECSAQ